MKSHIKHILVISDPPVAPGYLPRVRFLCDYLVQKGYDVTLLTEQSEPLSFEHTYPVITVPMYTGRTIDWFIKTVWTLLTDWHNRVFAKKFLTMHKAQSTMDQYDLVLCSAFSDFPLGAAQRIAKALQIPLICDIRDMDEQVDDSRYQYRHQSRWLMPFRRLYRAVHIRRRNQVLRVADAVTTVSTWHAEFIQTITCNTVPVTVMYNGYDEAQFYPQDIPTDTFRISYTGSLFEWQKAALKTVRQAISAISPTPSAISLDIHTPQHNPIRHNQLGDAIRQSSILLVLTSTHTHGMLTTKFYEALGCEKPILCVPSDYGALADLIDDTHSGIATDDIEQIQSFILRKYREWQTNGFTRQAVDKHAKELYSRTRQCALMELVIKTLTNNPV